MQHAPLALASLLLATACAPTLVGKRSIVTPLPGVADFERTEAREPLDILLQPDFSVPTHLRPCCAFGRDLEVRVSELPVPLVAVSNVIDPRQLGRHSYNGGLVSAKHGLRKGFVSQEKNGLVYTCRGGFIDLAHVRDYADWTVYLARRLEATLATGAALELPEEGGRRFIFLAAVDRDLLDRVGRRALAVRLAQWLAFYLSLWHETATWYGWASIDLFPEGASAFSPEDLYSNLLGIHVASYLVQSGQAETESEFNAAVDRTLPLILRRLGALPPDATRRAFDAVDGLWWSSQERLPSKRVVLRRSLDLGPEIEPWRIPEALVRKALAQDVAQQCASLPEAPVTLGYPEEIDSLRFDTLAKLEVRVDGELRKALPLPEPGSPWLSQRDLPAIVERVRAANAREFGLGSDDPDPDAATR